MDAAVADAEKSVTRMRGHLLAGLIATVSALTIAGCATVGNDAGTDGDRFAWQRRDGTALFGVPNSEASLIIECRPDERAVHLLLVGREDERSEPVRIVVDGVGFSGVEVPAPADGMGISHVAIPIDDPVVIRIGRGAQRIAFQYSGSHGSVPAGAVPAAMISDCRKRMGRTAR